MDVLRFWLGLWWHRERPNLVEFIFDDYILFMFSQLKKFFLEFIHRISCLLPDYFFSDGILLRCLDWPQNPGLKLFSFLSLLSSWDCRYTQLYLAYNKIMNTVTGRELQVHLLALFCQTTKNLCWFSSCIYIYKNI
jgi:hypothetical protein